MTPFKATKGTVFEGGFRVPCIIRWPGKVKPGTVENGIFSGLDWFPTLAAAAGNPDITDQLLKGVKLGDRTYKNHLDGYNQMDLLLGKGPSARHELFYFGGPKLGALRIDDFKFQFSSSPRAGLAKRSRPTCRPSSNIRQDPFERTPSIRGETLNDMGGGYMNDFYGARVLALRPRAARSWQAGEDGDRLSADAGASLLQPRGGQGAGRRNDEGARRAVA